MQVETYEVDELADATTDEIEEASAIAERLGLSPQVEAYARMTTTTDRRTLFREMTHEEAIIFGTVFDQRTPLEKFADPIPPRALRAIGLAKELRRAPGDDRPFFHTITIFHPMRIADDPLAVGYHNPKPGQEDWRSRPYMIARWGTALEEITALRRRCLEVCKTKIAKIESQVRRMREAVEAGDIAAMSSNGSAPPWQPYLMDQMV